MKDSRFQNGIVPRVYFNDSHYEEHTGVKFLKPILLEMETCVDYESTKYFIVKTTTGLYGLLIDGYAVTLYISSDITTIVHAFAREVNENLSAGIRCEFISFSPEVDVNELIRLSPQSIGYQVNSANE
jgi:hypothetical protein